MASPVELVVKVLADTTKATTALKGVGDTAKTTGGRMSGMAGALGGALAVGAVVAFGKGAVTAAEESASAVAGLEQAFLNAGDGTGQAAKDAQTYASQLSALIGVEDEQILNAQAQLATFSNLSDETARTSGVFDRTTAAAADLAAAGFGTLEGNAATLGKILQDPAAGLGKLQKLTGPLTDSQKELIAGMAEAGDVAGAQAAVLDILEGKVGGTAAATATSSEKMSVAFGEVSEAVGGVLLPILEFLAPILQTIAGFIQDNIDWLLPLAGAVLVLVGAIKLWNMWQMILNGTLVLNPIGLVIAAVVALIAIIILVIKNWDAILAVIKKVWAGIVAALKAAWDWITKTATAVWNGIKNLIAGVVTAIKTKWDEAIAFFLGIKDKVVAFFASAVNWLKDAGMRVINGLWNGLKTAWTNITTWIGGLAADIIGRYVNAGRWLFEIGKKIISGLWDGLKDMWDNVTGWFSGLGDQIADLKGPPSRDARLLVGAGKLIMGGLQSGLESGWGGVAGFLGSRTLAINGGIVGGRGAVGAGSAYTMNVYPRTVDPHDVAWGFRRLELQRGQR